jgi:hypothetical protein
MLSLVRTINETHAIIHVYECRDETNCKCQTSIQFCILARYQDTKIISASFFLFSSPLKSFVAHGIKLAIQ